MPDYRGGGADDAYLDKMLRYNEIELGFDESVGWRALWHLWLRAFIAAFVPWAVFAFFAALSGISSFASSASGGPPSGGSAAVLFTVGDLIGFVIFWVVMLFSKVPEPIAEWRVLLPDRGDKADSVYSHISGTLRERQSPIGWRVRRIRTGLGQRNVSNRLVMQERTYTAYVSVFSYGTSLYLGWMMWRSRRGASLVKQFILDVIEGMAGRKDLERQMMRTERPRAMREAIHAACREGLYSAAEGRDVPLNYGFPQGLPQIEDGDFGAAPIPLAGNPVQLQRP
ncbi:MAG TPA: hypothetical protein VEO01_09775 [Pseudonocardiaceae bacterium]|nr:hypothetical protein [Pseudonocardiaceae bacterium]